MSATAVAAAGAAVAYYFYGRRGGCRALNAVDSKDGTVPFETHQTAFQAPNTWVEALYFFAEGLRYMYGETLGKWRTADLLIGLAYLARKEGEQHPCADVAGGGFPLGEGLTVDECIKTLDDMRVIQRFMKYCQAMRERRPRLLAQKLHNIGIEAEDVLKQEPRAGVLRPSYMIIRDRKLQQIVVAIRGTQSLKDMFTNLTGASKPHHLVDSSGVVMGYSHFGMLAAARWIKTQTTQHIKAALQANPGYTLRVVGHSLGAGTAAMLTMMLREHKEFSGATCIAIACPACMTLELAQSCKSYITTIINGTDIVPTISPAAADALREEVMRSSWYEAFRNDIRSSFVVRAVEGSLRSVGSATMWTARATTNTFSSCVRRRPSPADSLDIPELADLDGLGLGDGDELPAHPRRGNGATTTRRNGFRTSEEDYMIEVAREWVEHNSDRMQPGGRGSRGDSDDLVAKKRRGSWWGASCAVPRRRLPAKNSNNGWLRWWLQGCRAAHPAGRTLSERFEYALEGDLPDHALQAEQLFQDSTAPPTMEMMMGSDSDDGDVDAQELDAMSDLSSEMSRELQSVEAAVMAAEVEEAMQLRMDAAQRRDTDRECGRTLENALQEGSAGRDGAGGGSPPRTSCRPVTTGGIQPVPSITSTSSRADAEQLHSRRRMYPAGRILHLAPAYLVYGSGAQYEEHTSYNSRVLRELAGDMQGEEDTGGWHSSPGQDTVKSAPLRWVLLDEVNQGCYARIRLCRTMIQDHFIPSYLRNLDSALHTMIEKYILPAHQAEAEGKLPPL